MIEEFEAALTDMLAQRVGTDPLVQVVVRPRDGLDDLVADRARVSVEVLDGEAEDGVGKDRDERLGPRGTRLRRVLRLRGRVRIAVEVGPASPALAGGQRSVLRRAADAVLVAMLDDDVRSGAVFGAAHEQGFELDALRLRRVSPPTVSAGAAGAALAEPGLAYRALDVWCDYSGRFWPTTPVVEGPAIEAPVRVRLVQLDPLIGGATGGGAARTAVPSVRAGGADLRIPVDLDLHLLGGAPGTVVARVLGATPPATLVGDTGGAGTGVPVGSVGYPVGADGRLVVVLRPAASVQSVTPARILLTLAGPQRATVRVGEFAVQVKP